MSTHKRQCSITVSINGDFFNCHGNEEEGEREGEMVDGIGGGERKVPSYLRSLWQEMDMIMKDIERVKCREALENQLSSSWTRCVCACVCVCVGRRKGGCM